MLQDRAVIIHRRPTAFSKPIVVQENAEICSGMTVRISTQSFDSVGDFEKFLVDWESKDHSCFLVIMIHNDIEIK